MLRFQWNALRPGDHVSVHDDSIGSLPLNDGVVALVEWARDTNEVAVRVTGEDGDETVERPRRHAVHLAPLGHDESCWRCRLAEGIRTVDSAGAAHG